MKLPHPHLIVLRSVATIILSCIIGQAGWAAAFIGGSGQYRTHHEIGAWVTVIATVLGLVAYLALRRSAGVVNVVLVATLTLAVGVQYAIGEAGATAAHIFLGVLIVMLATALTSWTYRHRMPASR